MKIQFPFALLLLSALYLPPIIVYAGDGDVISSDVKGKAILVRDGGPVFVSFRGSSAGAESIRNSLEHSGYKTTVVQSQATQILVLDGDYQIDDSLGHRKTQGIDRLIEATPVATRPEAIAKVQPVSPIVDTEHVEVGKYPQPPGDSQMSALSGDPVILIDDGRVEAFANQIVASGLVRNPPTCTDRPCKRIGVTQRVTLNVRVERRGVTQQSTITTRSTSSVVMAQPLLIRAIVLAKKGWEGK